LRTPGHILPKKLFYRVIENELLTGSKEPAS
jgi:hypothetical protein